MMQAAPRLVDGQLLGLEVALRLLRAAELIFDVFDSHCCPLVVFQFQDHLFADYQKSSNGGSYLIVYSTLVNGRTTLLISVYM